MSPRRPPEAPNLGHRQPPENSLQHCGASGFTMGPPRRDGKRPASARSARARASRENSLHHRGATDPTEKQLAPPPSHRHPPENSLQHRWATSKTQQTRGRTVETTIFYASAFRFLSRQVLGPRGSAFWGIFGRSGWCLFQLRQGVEPRKIRGFTLGRAATLRKHARQNPRKIRGSSSGKRVFP